LIPTAEVASDETWCVDEILNDTDLHKKFVGSLRRVSVVEAGSYGRDTPRQ